MYDIVIIGAGVVGALVARELSKFDLKAVILEKESDVSMGASAANSSIVHAGFDAKPGTMKAKMNVLGSHMMQKICDELGVKYKNNGALVVGFSEEDNEVLRSLVKRGKENGVTGLRLLNREETKKEEPNIGAEVTCALLAPTSAIVCPYELTTAAIGNAMDNGIELKFGYRVTSIEKTGENYIISNGSEKITGRFIINCAGIFSDMVAGFVGDNSFSITPRRGEYILLDKDAGRIVSHTVFQVPSDMGKGVLVTPTVDGNLLIGPTSEDIDDKTDTETTANGMSYLRATASKSVKGIPFSSTITSFAGLRAKSYTGDFIIKEKDGFINCAGIESPGLSSSPAIAVDVIELLKKAGLVMNKKADFNGLRVKDSFFSEMSDDEKNELIRVDERYGRIICRCEGVTEGEIVRAIHTNPPALTTDAVKRRTRSGMGRCQGGFCLSKVVEIISRETSIPYDKITKKGNNSYIITGRTRGGTDEKIKI